MNSIQAFYMGMTTRRNEPKVFDWEKAAKIIKEKNPETVIAGLQGDLEYTSGIIWEDGKPVTDSYTYLASTWATPIIILDGQEIDCFKMKHEVPKWDANTKWPKSALDIINEKAG